MHQTGLAKATSKVRPDLKRALEVALKAVNEDQINEAIAALKAGIAQLDESYGISPRTRADRARMEEADKHKILEVWLELLKAELQQSYRHYNSLVFSSLEESIDNLVKTHERELDLYRLRNRLHLMNMLYITYEQLSHQLDQRGAVDGARRMYYYRMVAVTKFRFEQVKHRPGWLRRVASFVRWVLLIFLWVSSDFGQNTLKFIRAILVLVIGFGLVYAHWGEFARPSGMPNLNLSIWWHKLIFSLYTSSVTLFALGGIQSAPADELTHGLMLAEFIFGYVFLGLLVAMMTKRLVR